MSSKVPPFPPAILSLGQYGLGAVIRANANSTPASVAWGTANNAIYMPFFVNTLIKFTTLIWRNGATISGNVDVGVFDEFGTKIVASGSTAASGANALQTATVASTSLNVGLYYFGLALSSATGTVFAGTATNIHFAFAYGIFNQATAFTLPATATFAAPTVTLMPLIGIGIT